MWCGDREFFQIQEARGPQTVTAKDVTGLYIFSLLSPDLPGEIAQKTWRKMKRITGEKTSSVDGALKLQISVRALCRGQTCPEKCQLPVSALNSYMRQALGFFLATDLAISVRPASVSVGLASV